MDLHPSHGGHRCAWRTADLPGGRDDLAFDLTDAHRAELAAALQAVRARGLSIPAIGRDDFPLPTLGRELDALSRELDEGRGVFVLRGFPLDRPLAEVETMFWGLGAYFGRAVSQSVMGDVLGHVIDVTDTDPHARAYRASKELSLHTDLSDIVSFLCVRQAEEGGVTRIASALAVHDEMLARHPDLLRILYRGFRWHRLGEQGPAEEPITPYRVPVLSNHEGHVSCRYVRNYIREAAHDLARPLSEEETAALDTFDAIARRPDMAVEFRLQPGEAIFMNNLTVLHARTAFRNGPDPAMKRLLVRLWLASHRPRPVVPELQIYASGRQGGVPGQGEGRTPSFARRASRD